MSWPQWSAPQAAPVPAVLNPAPPVLNPASVVAPPNLQYTPDQWAQMQQQNWNQWAQWQQQYQQWHQQYGAEYQKSMSALAQSQQPAPPVNVAVPPPLPTEPKPPLPTEDPPPPTSSYSTMPQQLNFNASQQPPAYSTVPAGGNYNTAPQAPGGGNGNNSYNSGSQYQNKFNPGPQHGNNYNTGGPQSNRNNQRDGGGNQRNQPWQSQGRSNNNNFNAQNNKRSFDYPPDHGGKRQFANKQPERPNQQQLKSAQQRKENLEELSEAERKFDKQFADWEAQFNKWKEQNVAHPDKEQYKEYEKKWETWRAQLLDRREQMRRKRVALTSGSPNSKNISPSPGAQGFNQPLPNANQPVLAKPGLLPTPFVKPPPNLNNEPLAFKQPDNNIFPELLVAEIEDSGAGDFLKAPSTGGIPGLDLVVEDGKLEEGSYKTEDVVVDGNKGDKPEGDVEKKGPDFEAISKGINNILGDPNLMNMLSMVSQNQNLKPDDSLIDSVSKIKDSSNLDASNAGGFPEQSNPSLEEHSNLSEMRGPREFVNNFDDQTRSSFTHNEPDMSQRNQRFDKSKEFQGEFDREYDRYEDYGDDGFRPRFRPDDDRFDQDRFDTDQDQFGPNQGRFGPPQDRFRGPNQGLNQDRFCGPNQDRFGAPHKDKFGQNLDKFGPNPDRFGDFKDKFGPNQDRFGGPGQDNFDDFDKDTFAASSLDRFGGPSKDKFGPNQDIFGGPNQDRFGVPNKDKFGPNQDRFGGPRQDTFGGPHKDIFDPTQDRFGGPNQDTFGSNQDIFSGPNKDKFGPNQDRFGGPNQDTFVPNQDRFGGPNKDKFGPNQDKFGGPRQDTFGGPHKDKFDPTQDRFGGPNQDTFGSNQDRFGGPNKDKFGGLRQDTFGGPHKDKFGPSQDRFGDPNQDTFGPNQDRFGGPHRDKFGSNQDRFGGPDQDNDNFVEQDLEEDRFDGPSQDRFGPNQGRFGGPNQNRFGGPNQDRFGGPNQNKFERNQDRFGPNQGRFSSSEDAFEPKSDRFGPGAGRFGPDKDNFGPGGPDRFGSKPDRFAPNKEQFGPPGPNQARLGPNGNNKSFETDDFNSPFNRDHFNQGPRRDRFDEDNFENDEFTGHVEHEDQEKINDIPEAPEAPAVPPVDDILKPATVIDYDHKSLKLEFEVLVEPIHMFDYRHKPLSRIPFPQRPRWLADTVNHIREFDPPVVRQYEPPNLRRYPPPDNWRNDRYPQESQWAPSGGRRGGRYGDHQEYDEPKSFDKPWSPPDNWRREGKMQEERKVPQSSGGGRKMEFEEENISEPEWDDEEPDRVRQESVVRFTRNDNINPCKPTAVLIEDILNPPGRYNRPPRIVIILRGPPGSGKTYLAKLIKDKEVENGGSAPRILSLDDYFMVEQEKEITEEGKRVKIKDMVYEYEAEMEESYRLSLTKSFKKTITDGYFSFIIVDNVNDKVKYFGEMWSFAKQNGFQVYICQMELDVQTCSKRNVHQRSEDDIAKCVEDWEATPAHHPTLDATGLLQSASIPEVEMEEVNSPESDECEIDGSEDQVARSKWDNFDCSVHNLAKLDGLSKPLRTSRTMEEYLRLDNEWTPVKFTKPGQKRVRWADLEERKEQEKMRAIGFVVGQTNWNRMMDPTEGGSALTQTKYIEKTGWQRVPK